MHVRLQRRGDEVLLRLADGDLPLCFLFSGRRSTRDDDGALQVSPISWEKEGRFRLPVATWRERDGRLLPEYAPGCACGATSSIACTPTRASRHSDLGQVVERCSPRRDEQVPSVNGRLVDEIANAVLYEGYILYPYRASALKNRQRFNFGVVAPRETHASEWRRRDGGAVQTECLAAG